MRQLLLQPSQRARTSHRANATPLVVLMFALSFCVDTRSAATAFVVTPSMPRVFCKSFSSSFFSVDTRTQQQQQQPTRHRRHTLSVTTEGQESSSSSSADVTTTTPLSNGTAVVNSGSATTTRSTAAAVALTLEEALDEAYNYRSAIYRTLGWVSAAVAFGGAVWTVGGSESGQEFFAGYLVEQSLSVDNLFVFLLLFEYFKIPLNYQDKILNWGIYGAIIMRGIMISLGATALENFHEVLLVFAAILVYSSAKFFVSGGAQEDEDAEEDPAENSIVQFSRSLLPSVNYFDEDKFFTLQDGLKKATPMFICMIAVEISDIVFAVDSIPAVFGVTENPLIVFSSNLFAIMGLRSLYTILSQAATDLKYLEPAVALVLGFIGSKMIAEYFGFQVPTAIALGIVATLLGSGIALSVWERERTEAAEKSTME